MLDFDFLSKIASFFSGFNISQIIIAIILNFLNSVIQHGQNQKSYNLQKFISISWEFCLDIQKDPYSYIIKGVFLKLIKFLSILLTLDSESLQRIIFNFIGAILKILVGLYFLRC